MRIEKRKWDGSVSAVHEATPVPTTDGSLAWFAPAGTPRAHPSRGSGDELPADEVWVAVPGEWWVLGALLDAEGAITDYVLHAAAPVAAPDGDVLVWIDLDLDFEVHGSHVALEDETQFHDHALVMRYPPDVVVGAWAGIAALAPRFTNREWPFDGSLVALGHSARRRPA